jgi:hypothetical protein
MGEALLESTPMFVNALFSVTYGRKKTAKTGFEGRVFVRCEAIRVVGYEAEIAKVKSFQ